MQSLAQLWFKPNDIAKSLQTRDKQAGAAMSTIMRNNVRLNGSGERVMVFAHGFGCDQNMWRFVEPAFRARFQTVLFDHVGAGRSDLSAYDPEKYATLRGYADDMVEIGRELGWQDVVFVGHSVSAMIGALASIAAPQMFSNLIMVGPSPCYVNDEHYVGGFSREQIEELLSSLADNHMGWSAAMAPAIMGNPNRPELAEELTNSFCRTDPEIAKQFARATFLSDNRADLSKITTRTLILQCSDDIIASTAVGEYVNQKVSGSQINYLKASGHCPNLSAPDEVIAAVRGFV
jgi:sigma-B regulation protein RsbQ